MFRIETKMKSYKAVLFISPESWKVAHFEIDIPTWPSTNLTKLAHISMSAQICEFCQ